MKAIQIIMLCISIALLSGCRTKIQYVPIESKTDTRDSIIYRDSVIERTIVHERDSTVTKDSTVIIMDDKGNIIRTELYREKERFRELNSDYRLLQARYDSLYQSKQTEIQIPYPVEKELSRWERLKIEFGGWAIGLISGLIVIGIGYIVKWLLRMRKK